MGHIQAINNTKKIQKFNSKHMFVVTVNVYLHMLSCGISNGKSCMSWLSNIHPNDVVWNQVDSAEPASHGKSWSAETIVTFSTEHVAALKDGPKQRRPDQK